VEREKERETVPEREREWDRWSQRERERGMVEPSIKLVIRLLKNIYYVSSSIRDHHPSMSPLSGGETEFDSKEILRSPTALR